MASSKRPGAAINAAAQLLAREVREPALHLIDLGAVRRCEVEVESRVVQQPALNQWHLVRALVVKHQIHIERLWNLTGGLSP